MSNGSANTGTMTQQQQPSIQQQQQQQQQQQNNGAIKKGASGGGSGGPTPAATPIQNGNGGQQGPSPPPMANAPKYGTLVPNRIFVGGITSNTTESELMQLFSTYGTVKAAKIIQDRAGVSKGYGFITFESEDDARRPLRDHDNIVLRERRLNIAPAIMKQPFGRSSAASAYDVVQGGSDGRSSAPAPHQSAMQPQLAPFFFGGTPQFYPGPAAAAAAAYYAPHVPAMVAGAGTAPAQVQVSQAGQEQVAAAAAAAQQAAVYQAPPIFQTQTGHHQAGPYGSVVFPQTIYMSQQYPMMPYDLALYGAGSGAPPTNGNIPTPYMSPGPSTNGGSPPRGAQPCYAQAVVPPDAAILYGPPPHQLFNAAGLDPAGGMPTAVYAGPDGTFESLGPHPAMMGQFGPLAAPYTLSEDGIFVDQMRAEGDATPRSFLTTPTPPIEQRSTATPVVSLLSLDHQQEKDAASMQGGRRPPAASAPHHHVALNHHHQHHNNHTPNFATPPPPPPSHHHHHHHHQQHHHQQHQQQQRRAVGAGAGGSNGNGYQNGYRRAFARSYNAQPHINIHTQMPPPPPPQQLSFGPPIRRPRKPSARRPNGNNNSTSSSGSGSGNHNNGATNEIGAGDAPLPNPDDALCTQVEVLKI